MTNAIATALANFAAAYEAYQMTKEAQPSNLAVAVQYATADTFNMVKTMSEADAVYVINDEAEYLREAIAKKAAA